MNIEVSDKPLAWGELDLSLFGISEDFAGNQLDPKPVYGFAVDQQYLWFVAAHQQSPVIHPDARPGAFQAELWKYDVAEFFILDPSCGHYLEFNLSPNSAWWSAEFSAPRIRSEVVDHPFPGVATYADMSANGSWLAAAALPLEQLRKRLNFGSHSRLNVSFIINSPEQRFASAAKLEAAVPDFHLPDQFPEAKFFHNQE